MTPTLFDVELGAFAMALYIHNTGGTQFVEDMFGTDVHPSYSNEKAGLWAKAPTRAISALDADHTRKLLGIVRDRWLAAAKLQLDAS